MLLGWYFLGGRDGEGRIFWNWGFGGRALTGGAKGVV